MARADLGELAARLRALAEHAPAVPAAVVYDTGQVAAAIARATGASVRVVATEAGVTVRFWGPGAGAASVELARQMGRVAAKVQSSAAHMILEELAR